MSKKLVIELPDDLVTFAEAKVSAGEYGSLDEAVAAGVRNLHDHDQMIERWVREEVVPSYDKWVADGKPTLSEEEVFAAVEAGIVEAARRKAS